MKTIYNNEIAKVTLINFEEYSANAIINDKENITLLIYPHYEYADDPLLFIPLPKTNDIQKLELIIQYEEWYSETYLYSTDWTLEYQVFVRNIFMNHLIVNPKYIELNDSLLMEVLKILKPQKRL